MCNHSLQNNYNISDVRVVTVLGSLRAMAFVIVHLFALNLTLNMY